MLAKEEAGMDIDDGEEGLRKGVCRRKRRVVYESDFVYQRRRRREHASSKRKGPNAQELLWNCRLVKIELDVAQALADFSRLAHLPGHHCPSDLKWFQRRKRTPRSAQKMEAKDALESIRTLMLPSQLRTNELDSTTSLSHGDKASPLFDSRAESPSSPLPSSKLACRAFLVGGGFASNLPIKRAVPTEVVQKPIKTEVEDLKSDSLLMSCSAQQTLIALNSQVSLCSVRSGFSNNLLNSEMNVTPLANMASHLVESKHDMGLVVVNKAKATLTEDDKEARRLRRIQANRESARQTIRKKQILCEELRRQSTSLTFENEGMKQKRDMLMQELCFLRGQNYHLKAQLELGASSHLGSHEAPSQFVSLRAWQTPSVPCTYTGIPSHIFGWPRKIRQEGNAHHSADPPIKEDNAEEHLQKIGSKQLQDTSEIVPGIPTTHLSFVGSSERSSNLNSKYFSPLPKILSDGGRSCIEVAATGVGPSCDADSTTADSQNILEREIGLELQANPELETSVQAKVLVSWHTAATPLRGDAGLMERHSTFRAPEHMEGYMGLKVPLAVTCGSSCNASKATMPMNGYGFSSSYAWRLPHVTPTAAAEARKRRKELTQKKRLLAKASKQAV